MDYSKLSDDTLQKLSNHEPLDYSKLKDEELEELTKHPEVSGGPKPAESAPIKEAPGYLESAGRGAAQGLTFGFADELQAGAEAALGDADYNKRVQEIRDQYKAAAEENPITYHGADFLSGFALPIGVIGGVGKGAKGALTLANLGRSAASGAAIGGLAAAGTSEKSATQDTGELAKDVALGAGVGAVAAPVMEGGISAIKGGAKMLGDKFSVLENLSKSFNRARATGEDITGKANLDKIQREQVSFLENEFYDIVNKAKKEKDRLYNEGKIAAADKSLSIEEVQNAWKQARGKVEANGDVIDPKVENQVQSLINKFGQQTEKEVTDPAEYQKLYREKLGTESQKLKEDAYKVQLRNAEKAGQQAGKEADKANREALKQALKEAKILNPAASNEELIAQAQNALAKSGGLKDPAKAAQEARAKVMAEAESAFKGTETMVEPTTGEALATASLGPNKRLIEPVQTDEVGQIVNNLSPKAGAQIEKMADKNSAYAYALAERENQKNLEKLASTYQDKQLSMSRQDLMNELQKNGNWIDPVQAAKQAKEGTRLSQSPVDIEKYFSPEINRDVLVAKAGEDELLTKILPQFKFTKNVYERPDLNVKNIERMRNVVRGTSEGPGMVQKLDAGSAEREAVGGFGQFLADTYNKMLGNAGPAARQTATDLDKFFTRLGARIDPNASSAENQKSISEALDRLFMAGQAPKNSRQRIYFEEAEKALSDSFKNADPQMKAQVQQAFDKAKDVSEKLYLSRLSTGENPLATSLTEGGIPNVKSFVPVAGKAVQAGTMSGLLVNKVEQNLDMLAKSFAGKGMKKYSDILSRMTNMQMPETKRRALLYTLMQEPEFRESLDGFGVTDDGK